ncbi:hypothetical protein CPAR01_04002 [Colletotrichum paranaense]|uniref:Uncharacterized protein n=1 Tax=Colletotrichum paranaense TaxID=1914294 RepID=A0ABQ9SVU0_9PEZI|nr:uncharacterized protein CPAR01_04002 [Colletotrichum paranaense]KAK1543369.1 hypothetical protein CPAR01_04002 [Colletotrichum paranaense]
MTGERAGVMEKAGTPFHPPPLREPTQTNFRRR